MLEENLNILNKKVTIFFERQYSLFQCLFCKFTYSERIILKYYSFYLSYLENFKRKQENLEQCNIFFYILYI